MRMTRDEHLAWAKKRALEYVDRGDLNQALLDQIEELLMELLTDTADQAYQRGVGRHLREEGEGDDETEIERALRHIYELQDRELIAATIQRARKR